MTRRRAYGTIAAMLAFLVVMLAAAPGCGPAAPAWQDGADAEATDIPASTDTLEPTLMPSPPPPVTPDLTKLGVNTEVVIAFLSVPTPDAALTGGSAGNGAGGAETMPAIPPVTLPPLIRVSISTPDLEATRRFLEAHGGTVTDSIKTSGVRNWNIWADMPPSILPALSQQPEVYHAFVSVIYKKVSDRITRQVIEYAIAQGTDSSLLTGEHSIKVIVEATPEGYANVRRFLGRYDVPVTRSNFSSAGIQMIPLNLIVPVSELPGVNFIKGIPIGRPAAGASPHW